MENLKIEAIMEKVIDRMMWDEPMKWQALTCDMDINYESLKAFRTWLTFTPIEKEIFAEDYPEFEWLHDDMLVMEMQHELLSALN